MDQETPVYEPPTIAEFDVSQGPLETVAMIEPSS